MKTEHFTLSASADGLQLAAMLVLPEGGAAGEAGEAIDAGRAAAEPRAIVQFVHGMCEHKERYEDTMRFLAEHGYACVIHDHRGHGASVKHEKDLGFLYQGGWPAMVDDIRVVNSWIHQRFPGRKVILFGHSMGSMAVRSYVKRYDDSVDALVVCGTPADNPVKGMGKTLAWCIGRTCGWHYRSQLLQRLSLGAYNKPFEKEGWPAGWVCSDPDILKAYHSDPLCQYIFTADGFLNLLLLMKDCYSTDWKASHTELPVHFISGAEDPCRVDDEALAKAVRAMKDRGYQNVSLKVYPGLRHEIHNETDHQEVLADILSYCR